MALVDRHTNDFLQEIKKLDPELRRWVNGSQGLFHVQIGELARWVRTAMKEGRLVDFVKANEIVARYFLPNDKRLEEFNNAVFVSYLEHLLFDDEAGAQAWEVLPSNLQEGHREIMAYMEAMRPKYPEHLTRKECFQARKKRSSPSETSHR